MKQNLRFGLVWVRLAVLKIFAIKLKYATFEGIFFYVFMDTTNAVHCSVRTKKLHNIGVFQLLDLIIPELKSHVIPYKFKCSHWWKIYL